MRAGAFRGVVWPAYRVVGLLVAAALLLPFPCAAEPPASHRVAVLKSRGFDAYDHAHNGFVAGLSHDVVVFTLGPDRTGDQELVSRILDMSPSLIHVIGTPAARALATRSVPVPVVYSMILNPGMLPATGGPVAGCVALPDPREVFREARRVLPHLRCIGVAYNPTRSDFLVRAGREAAEALGIDLLAYPLSATGQVLDALEQAVLRVDAFWILPDPTVLHSRTLDYILLASFRHRIPLLAMSERHVQQGALMALRADYEALGRRSARLAERLLRGAGGREPRYEFSTTNRLVLNLHTAETLGIEIPGYILKEVIVAQQPSVVRRATH